MNIGAGARARAPASSQAKQPATHTLESRGHKCKRGPRTPMRGDADTSSLGVLDPRNTDNTIRIRHTVRREDVLEKISRRASAMPQSASFDTRKLSKYIPADPIRSHRQ